MTKLYTVQVKFPNSNGIYDYACSMDLQAKAGDKALITGAYGEVKTVDIVAVLPLTLKTTKAISGLVKVVDHFSINNVLADRVKIQSKLDEEIKKLERKFIEDYLAKTNPEIAKLIEKRDAITI